MFRASPPSPCNLYFKHYLGPRCRYFLCFDFFPAFFKWTFATFVFGVHSFVCLVGEQPFCQQLRFYSGFNLGFCLFFLEADLSFRWTNQGRSRSWIYQKASYPVGSLTQEMKAHGRQAGRPDFWSQKQVCTSGLGLGLSLSPLVSLDFRAGTEPLPALLP